MIEVNGAVIDTENVDGYSGIRLPLHVLADERERQKFFNVCLWVREEMGSF